jgi:hypothetical protein
MAYNLFIAYDLIPPGQNYEAVKLQIKSLGKWHQFQYSFFYVSSPMSLEAAYAHVAKVMDIYDRLAVINAESGIVSTWDKPPIDAINAIWIVP